MRFEKLRLIGFKSFVEPTEFVIEPGLTGVVGPNGCGKSNLVEALRWVMGETSFKTMRASGMDDVIFAGAGSRPSRNMAEVGLVLDNAARTAPAGFNDADVLEVTRRLQRGMGSTYRINGREVRARDVQILFADASTGARSPAMVRQGQISEIIAARPQARRRILEEAAGIAGLHSRRHEASLRLKAADDNVVRLDDVLKQITGQIEGLKRQARGAARYRQLSADIRRLQAMLLLAAHGEAETQLADARRKLDLDTRDVAVRALTQAETARAAAVAADAMPSLRDGEARAAAALQRLVAARDALAGEERRAAQHAAELDRRIAQLRQTLARETALIEDAGAMLVRLDAEEAALAGEAASAQTVGEAARLRLAQAESTLLSSEKRLEEAQAALARHNAERGALERAEADAAQRLARLEAEKTKLARDRDMRQGEHASQAAAADLAAALQRATLALAEAEAEATAAERRHAEAREAEAAARGPLGDAARVAQKLETELQTLRALLGGAAAGAAAAVLNEIAVAKGYERALAAALGDDLDACLDARAPTHWAMVAPANTDPALPEGAAAMGAVVRVPAALLRRIGQIGIVDRAQGPVLQRTLRPGQRLVSPEGDLWRWDGLTATAEAPAPAARRLAEKNRLEELDVSAATARRLHLARQQDMERVQADARAAQATEAAARRDAKMTARAVEEARGRAHAAERAAAAVLARMAALDEGHARVSASRDEAEQELAAARAARHAQPPGAALAQALETERRAVAGDRAVAAEARAAVQSLGREADARQHRRRALASESASWNARAASARGEIERQQARLAEAAAEQAALAAAPADHAQRRRALLTEIAAAEAERSAAADRRASAETVLAGADRAARDALEALARARENRARAEAQLDGVEQRRDEVVRSIAADLSSTPADLPALAGLRRGEPVPARATQDRLDALRADRERLGGVNLQAEEELAGVEATHAGLLAERDDLVEAVKRLRQAILALNREGRERLLGAFDVVNRHFQELFTTLFGGGTAELQLVESDDPLEAGLEIVARPPGKRPATMTLLSGGEQALTALALIFGVFLTNPSPICVLDEVDAPLDDANVERFCNLLADIAARTQTRFLAITHNPITMARMDRLFGVTMAERGVSQLVSVDLQAAERLQEAG